ncbi:hypothetical protein, partial [Gilvimarinus sp. 1_MG-2023]|uniref:hypothetical protein n=1 Tax=Gilvimarinus sp. 1_MG-2023 TaxID=3062638 RepID=UPI0026E3236D
VRWRTTHVFLIQLPPKGKMILSFGKTANSVPVAPLIMKITRLANTWYRPTGNRLQGAHHASDCG